jgi:hypothetical protein
MLKVLINICSFNTEKSVIQHQSHTYTAALHPWKWPDPHHWNPIYPTTACDRAQTGRNSLIVLAISKIPQDSDA